MEYLTTLLVLSMAILIAFAIIISALGNETPKIFRIILFVSSATTIILMSLLITHVESKECNCQEYERIEEPVYYRINK